MRYIYTTLFYLLTPLILLRLYWRGFKASEYRKRWKERLAVYNKKYPGNVIWIHAVSVGESVAVFPLIKLLQQRYPTDNFLVTTTTPTGSARVKDGLASSVSHVYLPYDLPIVIKRFLTIFRPKIAIIMEKEIWPNLYHQCNQNNIPLTIINARLSAKSAKAYKKIPGLVIPALENISFIATQTEEDKKRFIEIGAKADYIEVTGNLKFDVKINEELIQQAKSIKAQLFKDRFIWIIASTHQGEEIIFYELYLLLKKRIPELLLLVVPRHPERFKDVKQLAEKMRLKTCMRSSKKLIKTDTDVYIADTMGELTLLYGAADISFVGGSLVPVGGHNILEPAAMNIPIIFGPHMFNSKEIAKGVVSLGAAIECMNKEGVMENVIHLYENQEERRKMVFTMSQFLKNNQGATETTEKLISRLLSNN
ncbi:MAG: lipid IV(A) 3-deoxy-D-manno-octulosonic acid transferase [Methylococcaceae bacterium]